MLIVFYQTKNPDSGLIDLIICISLYIFRKFQLRNLINPKKFTTIEWGRRNNTYIVIYNLLRKSKYYKDLEYEKKVEALNNEILSIEIKKIIKMVSKYKRHRRL